VICLQLPKFIETILSIVISYGNYIRISRQEKCYITTFMLDYVFRIYVLDITMINCNLHVQLKTKCFH